MVVNVYTIPQGMCELGMQARGVHFYKLGRVPWALRVFYLFFQPSAHSVVVFTCTPRSCVYLVIHPFSISFIVLLTFFSRAISILCSSLQPLIFFPCFVCSSFQNFSILQMCTLQMIKLFCLETSVTEAFLVKISYKSRA